MEKIKMWFNKYDWGTFEVIWDNVAMGLFWGGYMFLIYLFCEKLFG